MAKREDKQTLLLSEFIEEQGLSECYEYEGLESFSRGVRLHSYQKNSIKNALGLLCFWYDKDAFSNRMRLLKYYKKYDRNLGEQDIARASFWMATGSGKTIIMIKLMDLMLNLMRERQLPKKPIMLLVPNDKILSQFKENIKRYNDNRSLILECKELREYESAERSLFSEPCIYLARSDLLDSKENVGKDKKAKRLDYENYKNNEGWYILLDEAHRGENANSKRKGYFHELARGSVSEDDFAKGFVLNFSATFEDEIDFLSCAYNYNLAEFNKDGYGKNIAVLNESLDYKNEDNEEDRKRTILESFIIFNAMKKARKKLLSLNANFTYHHPLIIAVSNKVNTQDAGIRLYFKTILSILQNKVDIQKTALSLYEKLKGQELYFKADKLSEELLEFVKNVNNEELRKNIFYAHEDANLECYMIKGNGKEIAFCSKNSNKPFMLLNIANVKEWQKEFLQTLGVETIKDVSKGFFDEINSENSSINIMLGSKVFSEGWDSNRVNLISFINIGSINAKKYVLQTIGRGVRIEPFLNKRKRLSALKEEMDFKEACLKYAPALETLFIMASDNKAISSIIEGLNVVMRTKPLQGFKKTKILSPLPVPKYKNKATLHQQYKISAKEAEDLREFMQDYDEDVLIVKQCLYEGFKYSTFEEIKKFNEGEKSQIQKSGGNEDKFDAKRTLKIINASLNAKLKEFDKFEDLKDEIKHYKEMQANFSEEEVRKINEMIKSVVRAKSEAELEKEVEEGKISFKEALKQAKLDEVQFKDNYTISAKLKKHYYKPLVIYHKDDGKSEINFAITHKSEREFLQDLEKNLQNEAFLKDYKWCFSKLVEKKDEIYIPYFDEREQKERKFYPDFIFWLKKGKEFKILFIDPKGLSYEENAKFKINAFEELFSQILTYNNEKIEVILRYYNKNAQSDFKLKKYTKSSVKELFEEIL
ncbi:TPA: DEAD/DEAH box helicase family protein [Campylobacter upsaliensis]|nr:DEAD/DEAH box helicase family protein [Campylobacter upsaliensis]HEC1546286.1 DEAD/DEAH box helicase family protein [Campylobacter upsaliensis]